MNHHTRYHGSGQFIVDEDEVPPFVLVNSSNGTGGSRPSAYEGIISGSDPLMYQPADSPVFPDAVHQFQRHGAQNFMNYAPPNTVNSYQQQFMHQQATPGWQPTGFVAQAVGNESFVPDYSSALVDPETARMKEAKRTSNREAARRCRKKKEKQHDDLCEEKAQLEKAQQELLEQVAWYEDEIRGKAGVLLAHQCGVLPNEGGHLGDSSLEDPYSLQ